MAIWRNTDDADVIKFLKLFTDLDLSEIEKLSKLEGKELNEAKILLANEATAMCHSKEAAENAHQTAIKTFEQLSIGDNLPEYLVKLSEYDAIPLFKLLNICGLCQSGGDAKRLIKGRGVRINNEIVEDEALVLSQDYMRLNSKIKLSAGQKKHIVIVFAD